MKSLIGNYKKRRREEVKNPPPSSSSSQLSKRLSLEQQNTSSLLFHCREGSVTHFYHFFFGALVPLIEYHLANPSRVLRVLTDVGPFKQILCELPITISELHGPDLLMRGRYHDDKSLQQSKQEGEISLKGYDCFNNEFFVTSHFPKPSMETIAAVNHFFHSSLPFYICELPTYDVILIERAQDVYYQRGGCADRDVIYQTSGSERRSITNHQILVKTLQELCSSCGLTFRNISLERTSIYFQYHIFSRARVVVAQHGAALANIFFMASDGTKSTPASSNENGITLSLRPKAVVEISPPWSRQFEHFKNLAKYCQIEYQSVTQERDHSEVDVTQVVELVQKAVERISSPPTV